MSDEKPILLLDSEGQTLASYSLDQKDKAYEYAEELESMGIAVTLKEPSLPETLIRSLGANNSDTETLQNEIEEEISAHGEPCCGTVSTTVH
jgi:hypothetical protein